MRTEKNWSSAPISRTCEVLVNKDREMCGETTSMAYPAMNHGWMALCRKHSEKHPEATPIHELIASGEQYQSKL